MHVFVLSTVLVSVFTSEASAGARVSHFQPEQKLGANYWNGAAAIDGKPETAWKVPGESDNKGEWIEIDVPQGEVDKVSIFPGWGKTEETFADYPRLKKVRVDVFGLDDDQNPKQLGSTTVELADKAELQTLDVADTKVEGGLFGGKVRFTVLEVYDGQDFPNLAISEVQVNMKEYDAPIVVSALSAGAAGKTQEMMLDGNAKTAWAGTGPVSFTLTPNGFGVASIGFQAAGKDLARAKTIEITAAGITKTTVLPDKLTEMVWAAVPGFNGYTGGAFGDIEVKVVDTYPGAKSQEVGISELKGRATNHESI